ncbi:hypothetical protein CYR55_17880 [Chimaeribacter californicus]|uniref:Type II toxin-antitoxin system RelE/ParE family toxin n=2 Tax=Chimaeribacter californicus TaxID=2060067 RepID=A0A2N5DZA4_9GAMM|nr:hypothetical protein CYR55_17880 [Chimaeribacter californicus]
MTAAEPQKGGRRRAIPPPAKTHTRTCAQCSGALHLARKLDIINAATSYKDLRSPPGNRYEELNPPLEDYSAIRVNEQYRLIFKWIDGKAVDLYLDTHRYKKQK